MAEKRNLIIEINSIKERSEYNSRYDYMERLNSIEYAFKESIEHTGDFNQELLKYIPIATVACLETFLRSVVKELIDFGKPYSDNVVNFNQAKNVKFDFDIVRAIQTKTLTVGEFISHILPCNSYDDINANLSTLIGEDFTTVIKTFKRESIYEKVKEAHQFFTENCPQILADIKRTFELRHIFCHESATNVKINKEEIFRCFNNCKVFLNHINDFIWALLYPSAPETQTDMNRQAYEDFEKAEAELTELITTIKEASHENTYNIIDDNLFDASIEQWKLYRESRAKLKSHIVEGGTIYSCIYSSNMTATTKEKIDSLKNEYQIDLRRYATNKVG